MKVVVIIGPHAVGKMTVGQALERLSGLKLFHNHQTIDLVAPYFSYGTPEGRRLVGRIREAFFETFADSGGRGYILTFVWAFELPSEREYIDSVARIFEARGHEMCWVELEADVGVRLARNRSENRLAHKASKRDLAFSEDNLLKAHAGHRLNSLPGEMPEKNYLRIDNTDLSADDVAQRIFDRFLS